MAFDNISQEQIDAAKDVLREKTGEEALKDALFELGLSSSPDNQYNIDTLKDYLDPDFVDNNLPSVSELEGAANEGAEATQGDDFIDEGDFFDEDTRDEFDLGDSGESSGGDAEIEGDSLKETEEWNAGQRAQERSGEFEEEAVRSGEGANEFGQGGEVEDITEATGASEGGGAGETDAPTEDPPWEKLTNEPTTEAVSSETDGTIKEVLKDYYRTGEIEKGQLSTLQEAIEEGAIEDPKLGAEAEEVKNAAEMGILERTISGIKEITPGLDNPSDLRAKLERFHELDQKSRGPGLNAKEQEEVRELAEDIGPTFQDNILPEPYKEYGAAAEGVETTAGEARGGGESGGRDTEIGEEAEPFEGTDFEQATTEGASEVEGASEESLQETEEILGDPEMAAKSNLEAWARGEEEAANMVAEAMKEAEADPALIREVRDGTLSTASAQFLEGKLNVDASLLNDVRDIAAPSRPPGEAEAVTETGEAGGEIREVEGAAGEAATGASEEAEGAVEAAEEALTEVSGEASGGAREAGATAEEASGEAADAAKEVEEGVIEAIKEGGVVVKEGGEIAGEAAKVGIRYWFVVGIFLILILVLGYVVGV